MISVTNKKNKISSVFAIIIGMFSNLFLSVAKIVVGALFGSIAVIADGVNNASDFANSLITFLSYKIFHKPADEKHPFGHKRIEYITTFFIAIAIIFISVSLIKSSIEKLISGQLMEVSMVVFIILSLSIVVKFLMGIMFIIFAKLNDSTTLKATGVDCLLDCLTTTFVLISSIIFYFTKKDVDGYFGIVVSLIVFISGISIIKDAINPLLGSKAPQKMINEILEKIKKYNQIYGVHDLLVHNYGPNQYFVSVHIEVDGNLSTNATHELANKVEEEIKAENIHITVHVDPVGLYLNDDRIEFKREIWWHTMKL